MKTLKRTTPKQPEPEKPAAETTKPAEGEARPFRKVQDGVHDIITTTGAVKKVVLVRHGKMIAFGYLGRACALFTHTEACNPKCVGRRLLLDTSDETLFTEFLIAQT
jgi:hypothetical protein